jgi:hypothetical protein
VPTKYTITSFFATTTIISIPGLLERLESKDPPTLVWFTNLEDIAPAANMWSMYVLIHTKPGKKSLIYMGSGIATDNGTEYRLTGGIAKSVLLAIARGYEITHRKVFLQFA